MHVNRVDHHDDANERSEHVAALRDPNNTLLVLYAGGVMSVSEDSGGALIRAKRCACGIPPVLWGDGHGNALPRFVKESLGDTLEAS